MNRLRLFSAGLILAFAVRALAVSAIASGETSDVVVDVIDAASGAPVALARVLLQGENGTIGYTDAAGRARFESVATGTYRAMVTKRAYTVARSRLLDVRANATTNLRVALAKAGGTVKTIGRVTVSSAPARASRDVGQDDALRFLDGSLRDAVGDLPGVTGSGDGFAIDGNDAAQSGSSVDGIGLPGAGGGLGGRGINADLFAGASVSSGASNGALAGSVGFRTLQPTRFPQALATLHYASDNSSAAIAAMRGSFGNLGYVVQHAVRGRTNPLTGATFTDTTGLNYLHDGDRRSSGDLFKLRWAPALTQTLAVTAATTQDGAGVVCAQYTANVPCGSGPRADRQQRGRFVTIAETATIGATTVFAGGFLNDARYDEAERARSVAGIPAPLAQSTQSFARGATVSLQFPASERHELSLNAGAYGLTIAGTSSNAFGTFPLNVQTAYRSATIADRYRPNAALTFTTRGGVNGGSGNASATGSLDMRWQPATGIAYSLSASAGDAGAAVVVSSAAFPDPADLTYDCAANLASGRVPSGNASRQRSSAVRAGVERSVKHVRLAVNAWSQFMQSAPALVALDPTGIAAPAGYAQAVAGLASSSLLCGAPVGNLGFFSSVPADQRNRGATVSGTVQSGSTLFAGYASVQSRFLTASSALLAAATPLGAQVLDTPLHRAGLVVTSKVGRSIDLLANLSYVGANNANRLPAYTLVNAGFAVPLKSGSLAAIGTNLGNRGAARFGMPGNGALRLPTTPLAARAVALTYTVRAGRLGAAGSGAGTSDTGEGEGGGVRLSIHAEPLPARPPTDALTIDADNEECSPIAARSAQRVLDTIAGARDAAERAKRDDRYPATLAALPASAGGTPLRYTTYDDRTRYAIVATAGLPNGVALINCARLHGTDASEAAARHLLWPPALPTAFSIVFVPSVGLYLLPPSAPRGGVRVTASLDPEPATPPAAPFAPRDACPAAAKPLADALVAAVRAARDAQRANAAIPAADVAGIVAHGGATPWLAIETADPLARAAALQCLHVTGMAKERLNARGIDDDRRQGGLGFADAVGFYSIGGATSRP